MKFIASLGMQALSCHRLKSEVVSSLDKASKMFDDDMKRSKDFCQTTVYCYLTHAFIIAS